MNPLDITGLSPLMTLTRGLPQIKVGLIDGPVADHPDLARENMRTIPDRSSRCTDRYSEACRHGTFIAGILTARRDGPAPAICPGCTLLIRPIFLESVQEGSGVPSAFPVELAAAIVESIDHGARILNLSIELVQPCPEGDRALKDALDHAAARGTVVVAAAGNQGIIGGSALTRHPWVIPVAACDLQGRPTAYSNRTGTINRKGLMAPGEKVASIGSSGHPVRLSGTSVSVPFVAGAAALLWSLFPSASACSLRAALTLSPFHRRPRVPPLLAAWSAWESLCRRDTEKKAA
jgi:subtilisin family serine protease